MKFAVAALLGLSSAALSQKQLLHNQLVALSGMVSEFDAPEKDAIFNKIAERKDELANQLLAHPEHTESILSEVATLKGLVRTVDAQNYDGAMSLMEARKDQLKSQLLSLADEGSTTEGEAATTTEGEAAKTTTEGEAAKTTTEGEAAKTTTEGEAAKTPSTLSAKDRHAQILKSLDALKTSAADSKNKEAEQANVDAIIKALGTVEQYEKFDVKKRESIDTAFGTWLGAYNAWQTENDATKKADLLKTLQAAQKTFESAAATGSSGTVFIVIGVLVVVAAAVAGGIYYKKRNTSDKEGGEADDRKLYKSQIASVNAHKKAQKVALVDADV